MSEDVGDWRRYSTIQQLQSRELFMVQSTNTIISKTYNINQLAESSSIDLTRCFVGGSMHFSSDNRGGISVSVSSQAGD